MTGTRFVLLGGEKTEVQPFEIPQEVGFGECLLRVEHSLISPGTEMLVFRSYAGTAVYCPGYTAVGRIVKHGGGIGEAFVDKPVFFFPVLEDMNGCHASHKLVKRDAIWVAVPEGLDPAKACYARMINVAMTPFCHLDPRTSGFALIVGLGIVGNLAAQIAEVRGFTVIGVDPDAARRKRAENMGVAHLIDPAAGDTVARVKELTEGQGANLTINATGAASTFMTSVEATATGGEVSTLGGARGEATINLADLLNRHVQGRHITLRGGWEVMLPRTPSPGNRTPSTQDNLHTAMRWLNDGTINVDALWTHRLNPGALPEAYRAIRQSNPPYMGVTIDWR